MRLAQVEWVPVTRAALKEYGRDDIGGLAAEMAYWIIFSIVPFFVFLATLVGLIGQAIGRDDLLTTVTDNLYSVLDPATAATLHTLLGQVLAPTSGALSVGALLSAAIALNSAATAILTTMKAFNRAYGVAETRHFLVLRLTGLGLTLLLSLLLLGGSLLLAVGDRLIGRLALGAVSGFALNAVRIAGAFALISLGLATLYWKGVNVRQEFRWLTPGALLSTLGLAAFSGLFGLYLRFFAAASFNKTYGSLAGVFLFLLFLRYVSTIVLLGAELNAEVGKRYDPAVIRGTTTDPREQLPGAPPPDPRAARAAGVSGEQVAAGGGGTAAATAAQASANGNGADATGGRDDVEAADEERLRALRRRPLITATEQVRTERAHRSPAEREERAKAAAAAVGVSAATAVGAVLAGALRRRA